MFCCVMVSIFADSVITVPAPKTEHQSDFSGNPLLAAGHARFGPSKRVGAQAGLSVFLHSKREAESWLLNKFALSVSESGNQALGKALR